MPFFINSGSVIANKHLIRLIFGLKVKELRKQRRFSFAELSERSGLSLSYLNEIEKGKKYPKTDKILALSEAFDVSYDHLVSLKLSKKLSPVADLLKSNLFQELPLEFFGLELSQVLELITNAPTKINAFISTLIEIARNYEMQQEQFYFAAIRSFQELNDNYFEEIEDAVTRFTKETALEVTPPISRSTLYDILTTRYGYTIDKESLGNNSELLEVRSLYNKKTKTLLIKPNLSDTQIAFLLGREIAFNYLELEKRPYYTPFLKVNSFEEALNNLKASYFSVALLINRTHFIEDLEKVFALPRWENDTFNNLLERYNASPEMLHQRLTNILPKHFGIRNLFMLRFSSIADSNQYFITKELHLAKLHSPHANEINEHYCRRWVSLNILDDLREKQKAGKNPDYISDFQRSGYVGSRDEYLCISIARPNSPTPGNV
ncbi:MAG: transcriptional regulator with XRE-family HTH domain, partial [Limisphaerales bacterium]